MLLTLWITKLFLLCIIRPEDNRRTVKAFFKNVIYLLKPTIPSDSETIFANRLTKELKFEVMGLS